jgi:hypothetical protein
MSKCVLILSILTYLLCGCVTKKINTPKSDLKTVYPVLPYKESDMIYRVDTSDALIIDDVSNKSVIDNMELSTIYWMLSTGIVSIFLLSYMYRKNII